MKRLLLIVLLAAGLLGLAGCQSLDVIGKDSARAFDALLAAAPELVAAGADGFTLTAPDDSARLIWRNDGKASDLALRFSAAPFIDAGLDLAKLPAGMVDGDTLVIAAVVDGGAAGDAGADTALTAFERILWNGRDRVMYHADMGHFGVSLGVGVFEWAQDMHKNDKDIVFALDPQPFIDAGVDPAKVAGWAFAKVKTMEANGRKVEVDKLLKPFNLI